MSGWTDERIALAAKLWKEGQSATDIAARLGGVSRNAVLGILHRKGLSGRMVGTKGNGVSRAKRAEQRAKIKATKAVARGAVPPTVADISQVQKVRALFKAELPPPCADEVVIPMGERKGLAELDEHDCRWPIGDPGHEGFHFCAKGKVNGLPYCSLHARRAVQPPKATANRGIRPAGGDIEGPMQIAAPETIPAAGGASERETEDA